MAWYTHNYSGGVHIADGAIVGGGSVVVKDIGPYEIWAGNPAKFIKKRFDDETIEELLKVQWWNMNDDELFRYGNRFPDVNKFLEEIDIKWGNTNVCRYYGYHFNEE